MQKVLGMTIAEKIKQGKRKNRLLRYQAVMDEFNKHDCRYIPISVIYREFIYPKFFISRTTFYQILNTPTEEMPQHSKAQQLSLF